MTDGLKVQIVKLNASNYQVWKFKLELLLIKEELWGIVQNEAPNPVTDKWTKQDAKARSTIGLLVEDTQLKYIKTEATAKGMWDALKRHHEKATLSLKTRLLKRLCRTELKEGADMKAHIADIEGIMEQLSVLGYPLAEDLCVTFYLQSLPESYNHLITALDNRPETDLTEELVKNKLLEEYERQIKHTVGTASNGDQVLNVKKAQAYEGMKVKNTYIPEFKRRTECFFCKKPGHIKKECYKYIVWKKKNSHQAKLVDKDEEVEETVNLCFLTTFSDNDDLKQKEPIYRCSKVEDRQCDIVHAWYLDSGASVHMCVDRQLFIELNEGASGSVCVADGRQLQIKGKGTCVINTMCNNQRVALTLENVLYVPELDGNLLSVGTLVEKNCRVHFQENHATVEYQGKVVFKCVKEGKLFKLKIIEEALKLSFKEPLRCVHEWHSVLAHRNLEDIKKLSTSKMGTLLQISPCDCADECEVCLQGKLTRKPFSKVSSNSTTEILDLVHSDICGPLEVQTVRGYRYALSMIDDYSSYTKVYLLKNKSEAKNKVRQYVEEVKTQFGRKPKVIRTDRGGEYVNAELMSYFASEGIRAERTAPYSPEQNGCAERKNRTLIEAVRCLLKDSNLGKKYWGEAIHTANYIQNCMPVKGRCVTPYEVWFQKRPNYAELIKFGSKVYVHVPEEKRLKLDQKAQEGIFVGYEDGTKGYRILDKENNTVKISRDVKEVAAKGKNNIDKPLSIETDLSTQQMTVGVGETSEEEEQAESNSEENRIRRSSRQNKGKPPERLIDVINCVQESAKNRDPVTVEEAISSDEGTNWMQAMKNEMNALMENKTWELTELPEGETAIGCRWIFKKKVNDQGEIMKYKARLVAQGYAQQYGHSYDEVFAPVVRPSTLKILLTVAGERNLKVKHYDFETAFLNGSLSHVVYMKQPEFFKKSNDTRVCKLSKSLYGLKQGANEWYKSLSRKLLSFGYIQSENDPCLFKKNNKDGDIYVAVHVDDICAAASSDELLEDFEKQMDSAFKMKNLGEVSEFLGIQIERKNGTFYLHQQGYIDKKLDEFRLSDARESEVPMDTGYRRNNTVGMEPFSQATYRAAIGSLLYLSNNTRPDIAAAVGILAQKTCNPQRKDWIEVQRVFRYLKGSKNLSLALGKQKFDRSEQVCTYVDADWAGDISDRKSNSGFCVYLKGSLIYWSSRKQDCVSLSSTQAEYIALADAGQEVLWTLRVISDFDEVIHSVPIFYEDNQSCIHLLFNDKINRKTKHIETKFHFLRNLVKDGTVQVKYKCTSDMIADILTKPLERQKVLRFRTLLGLRYMV